MGGYQPDPATVGLLFTPETPMIDWSINGEAMEMSSAFLGYARALERLSIPYEVLEPAHLDRLDQVKLVIMPEPVSLSPDAEERLLDYVAVGGQVFVEALAQAWDQNGLFHYSGKERQFISALGLRERCRKHAAADAFSDAWSVTIPARWALTPWIMEKGDVLGRDSDGEPLLVKVSYGAGQVYALGTWAAYGRSASPELASFVKALCQDAGALPAITVVDEESQGRLIWRTGLSGESRLFFLINLELHRARTVRVTLPNAYGVGDWRNLATGREVPAWEIEDRIAFDVELDGGEAAVLVSQLASPIEPRV